MILRSIFFVLLSCLTFYSVKAQERCATTLMHTNHHSIESFEKWLSEKRNQINTKRLNQNGPFEIPVVVHIVHNGEPIGTRGNISDEKVIEQINILNADFRRTNADAINTPSVFTEFAVDTEISFVMAKQDPEGLATNGITRSRGSISEFRFSDDLLLKSQLFWPPEDYLNIYVASINSFLGYAQFPVNNLEGLRLDLAAEARNRTERITDGIVVDWEYWGINPDTPGSFESFGRTATHEVGHYLGLRHIWGDGGCSIDDFCADTPLSSNSSSGCPFEKITCGSRDMVENYMDFTNDVCMNLFTRCQSERMKAILDFSPRRKTLTTSQALSAPQTYLSDLGIRELTVDNSQSTCLDEIRPVVSVRNYGTELLNSFDISLSNNGTIIQTINSNITLPSLATTTISFEPVPISLETNNQFEIEILSNDERNENNISVFNIFRPATTPIPHQESFPVFPTATWETSNGSMWQIGNAAFETASNNGFVLPYFDAPSETLGNFDFLTSPVFNLNDPSFTSISFRYAFAPNKEEFNDGLIVAISTDCGQTFPRSNYVFEEYGSTLATSPALSQEFSPISSKDWRRVNLDLSAFEGNEIRIAFIGHNGNGNNIYLDDFQIGASSILSTNAAVGELSGFSIAACEGVRNPTLEIINDGTETINSVDLTILSDGTEIVNTAIDNLRIRPGRNSLVRIPINLQGQNLSNITVDIRRVNNLVDEDISNNTFSSNLLVNVDESTIPIRENFDDPRLFAEVSSSNSPDWKPFVIQGNNTIYSANFNQLELGKENWLVSPIFPIEDLTEGSLSFDVSYAQRNTIVDGLRVLLSTNCGIDWSEVIYNKRGSLLATSTNSTAEWFPSVSSDWRTETIDLTSFITDPFNSQIRIAFVTTNGNGNNIFLDNIQIFPTQEPNLINNGQEMTVFPNPANSGTANLAISLSQQDNVVLSIIDVSGRIVVREELTNALNQRYTFSTTGLQGVYFIRLKGENTDLVERILIGQ